jgi:hypothetical protein
MAFLLLVGLPAQNGAEHPLSTTAILDENVIAWPWSAAGEFLEFFRTCN